MQHNTMNTAEVPTPEFMAQLDRAMHFELRRVTQTRRDSRGWHLLRAAALAALAFGAGAGAVVAAERVEDSRRAAYELARNELERTLAERRLAHHVAAMERTRSDYEAGRTSMPQLELAEARSADAERLLKHLTLEREALQRGGPPLRRTGPRRVDIEVDLAAPLVGPRDFVSEHLRVELAAAREARSRHQRESQRAAIMAQSGLIPQSELSALEAGSASHTTKLASIERRLELRSGFLLGRYTQAELETLARRTDAELRERELQALVEHLSREAARTEQLVAAGAAPSSESAEKAVELNEALTELGLVQLELELLR